MKETGSLRKPVLMLSGIFPKVGVFYPQSQHVLPNRPNLRCRSLPNAVVRQTRSNWRSVT